MFNQTKRLSIYFYLASAAVLAPVWGCGSADEPVDEAKQLNPLFACINEDFSVNRPLKSEQYDPQLGGLIDPQQQSYVIHTTQIFVPPESEGAFFEAFGPIVVQLDNTPGLIAYSLAGDAGCGDFRTLGIWESEEAMYAFVLSGAHAEAMPKTSEVSEAARVTHWQATLAEVNALNWDVAKAKIGGVPESTAY